MLLSWLVSKNVLWIRFEDAKYICAELRGDETKTKLVELTRTHARQQCDQMVRLFFSIFGQLHKWKLAQQCNKFAKVGSTFYQIEINLQKFKKTFKILPKCQIFAQSGHSARQPASHRDKGILLSMEQSLWSKIAVCCVLLSGGNKKLQHACMSPLLKWAHLYLRDTEVFSTKNRLFSFVCFTIHMIHLTDK